jgi:hypothetical protein
MCKTNLQSLVSRKGREGKNPFGGPEVNARHETALVFSEDEYNVFVLLSYGFNSATAFS